MRRDTKLSWPRVVRKASNASESVLVQLVQDRAGFYSYEWLSDCLKPRLTENRRLSREMFVADDLNLPWIFDARAGGVSPPEDATRFP